MVAARILLVAGGGADGRFVYASALDSTGMNFRYDFRVQFFPSIVSMFRRTISNPLSTLPSIRAFWIQSGSFNSELAAAVDTDHLAGNDAVLFTPDSGSLAGHTFLIVDLNGAAGYQAGEDLVVNLTGATGTLVKGDFV